MNFFQIEGETGYIYIKDGSGALGEVKVVTKESEEIFNDQNNPDRWSYEVHAVTKLLLEEDYDAVYRGLDTMMEVVEVLESSRKKAGIFFPGD